MKSTPLLIAEVVRTIAFEDVFNKLRAAFSSPTSLLSNTIASRSYYATEAASPQNTITGMIFAFSWASATALEMISY